MKKNTSILLIFLATVGYGLMPIFTLIAYKAGTSAGELVLLRFAGAALLMWVLLAGTGALKQAVQLGHKKILRIVIMIGIPFTLTILTKFIAFYHNAGRGRAGNLLRLSLGSHDHQRSYRT